MATKTNGGPAFPHGEIHDQIPPYRHIDAQTGMSLRDYMAAKAMHGICAHDDTWGLATNEIAKAAYKLADAMIAAREAACGA